MEACVNQKKQKNPKHKMSWRLLLSWAEHLSILIQNPGFNAGKRHIYIFYWPTQTTNHQKVKIHGQTQANHGSRGVQTRSLHLFYASKELDMKTFPNLTYFHLTAGLNSEQLEAYVWCSKLFSYPFSSVGLATLSHGSEHKNKTGKAVVKYRVTSFYSTRAFLNQSHWYPWLH